MCFVINVTSKSANFHCVCRYWPLSDILMMFCITFSKVPLQYPTYHFLRIHERKWGQSPSFHSCVFWIPRLWQFHPPKILKGRINYRENLISWMFFKFVWMICISINSKREKNTNKSLSLSFKKNPSKYKTWPSLIECKRHICKSFVRLIRA